MFSFRSPMVVEVKAICQYCNEMLYSSETYEMFTVHLSDVELLLSINTKRHIAVYCP